MEAQPAIVPRPRWHTFALGRNPRLTAVRIAVVVLTSFVLFRYCLVPIRVTGISMEPTYRDGQINLLNRLAYRFREPVRGDVVGIRNQGDRFVLFKRIIGLPGERVRISRGTVYIDGEPLTEPYLARRAPWNLREFQLGGGEYFVVGDNRSMREWDHLKGITTREYLVGPPLW